MYGTMTVDQFTAEIRRKRDERQDYIRPTSELEVRSDAGVTRLFSPDGDFLVTDHAHAQISQDVGVPINYYRRMLAEEPQLFDRNVNTWLTRQSDPALTDKPRVKMVRTLPTPGADDRHARAYVSNSYLRLDDWELMEYGLGQPLGEIPGLRVESCNVDENIFYLKAVADAPQFSGEVRKIGDIVQLGVSVRNSETAFKRLVVEPLLFELTCLNGMVVNVAGLKGLERVHRGERLGVNDGDNDRYTTARTRALKQMATWSEVADVIRGTFQEPVFQTILTQLRDAAGHKIEAPTHAIEAVTERYGLSENESEIVQDYISGSGEWDQWGLVRGITWAANHADSYNRATELENVGTQILALKSREWTTIAQKS